MKLRPSMRSIACPHTRRFTSHEGCAIDRASAAGSRVRLASSHGDLEVDFVILATRFTTDREVGWLTVPDRPLPTMLPSDAFAAPPSTAP